MTPDKYVRVTTGTEFEGKQPYLLVDVYDPKDESWHTIRATAERSEAEKVQGRIIRAIHHAQVSG